jgi:hypothetical protein
MIKFAVDLSKGKISIEKIIRNIHEYMNSIQDKPDFQKSLQTEFRSQGFYRWESIRYFLFEYNLSLQEKSKTNRPKIFWPEFVEDKSDFVSVEHIYPQRTRNQYWVSRFSNYTTRERKALRDSLGNLLPLSRAKNASLQNIPFPEKAHGRSDENVISYRFCCYAENEVAKYNDWNPFVIMERGLKLLKFLEKRWNLILGKDKDKIRILNVEFVLKKEQNRPH